MAPRFLWYSTIASERHDFLAAFVIAGERPQLSWGLSDISRVHSLRRSAAITAEGAPAAENHKAVESSSCRRGSRLPAADSPTAGRAGGPPEHRSESTTQMVVMSTDRHRSPMGSGEGIHSKDPGLIRTKETVFKYALSNALRNRPVPSREHCPHLTGVAR